MPNITLSSHDLLGKLTILKNLLFLLNLKKAGDNFSDQDKEYLAQASKTVEEMIEMVKKRASR